MKIMEKFFNNAGPQQPEDHYTLDPLARFALGPLMDLIDQKRYFVLHAPRQTGKTTAMYALMHHLNAGGKYRCLYVNIEGAQALRENVIEAMASIGSVIADLASLHLNDDSLKAIAAGLGNQKQETDTLRVLVRHLSAHDAQQPDNPRPLVMIIDEIDALVGDSLISVLRQIRAGYADRPRAFAHSLILCGVRDVRDYRIHSERSKEIITGGSAFNIKAESLRLGNFTEDDVNALYQQHTDATGQVFTAEARALAWVYTQGQPWLVNALAHEATSRMTTYRDRSLVITGEVMRQAKERLIQSRATHLDILIDKLREPRIRRVIQPILDGQQVNDEFTSDDVQYTADMGLVRRDEDRIWVIANDIYKEIIPRELTNEWQDGMAFKQSWYITPDGTPEGQLNLPKLLTQFQQFFREHSEGWIGRFDYKEAGPQLLLQAYLQRIVNGGGRIEREYGLGLGRTDLYVTWPACAAPRQRMVIELKLIREKDSASAVLAKGLTQVKRYQDQCGATEAHLMLFNRHTAVSWDDKISHTVVDGVTVWGC
jgi:AAA domain